MTVPFTDWQRYFSDPQAKQNELNSFNAMVDAFRQSFGRQQQISMGVMPTGATYPEVQQQGPITPDWHDDDLVGAAAYWGIPEETARQMPREGLIEILNQKRSARDAHGSAAMIFPEVAVGAMQGALHGLFNLPYIGESARRVELLQKADYQLHKMEEGLRASAPQDLQWAMTGANVVGNVASMWLPAEAAWAVAGKLGQVGSAVLRSRNAMAAFQGGEAAMKVGRGYRLAAGAFQGGLSTAMLEGGSDAFQEHPMLFTGAGIGLGVTGAAAADWLARRVTKSFVPVEVTPPPAAAPPSSGRIVTGSTQFRDAMVPMQGQELPPGGMASPAGFAGPTDDGQVLSGSDAFFGFRNPPPPPAAVGELDAAKILSGDTNIDPADMEILTNILHGPRIPKGYTVDETGALVAQMNKAATIVQSPVFPEVAGQALIDDASVLAATEATNPGGAQIIQGVADPAKLIESMPANTFFVPKGNRLDALVLPPEIDANRAIQQYQRFGLFEGQKVLTQEGVEGTLSAIDKDGGLFTPTFGGPPREVGIKELQSWLTTGITQDVPQLWDGFVQYAAQRAQATAASMGAGESAIASISKQNLPHYAEDFLSALNITDPANRAKLTNYFNKRYVAAFKDLAPAESALQDAMSVNYNNTATAHPQTPLQALDEVAASKGFIAIPDGASVIVKDASASAGSEAAQLRFDSIDAAHEWVRNLNRELPDITPPSDIPLEVMGSNLREATQGSNLNRRAADKIAESISELSVSDGGVGFVPPSVVEAQAGGSDNIGRLKNLWSDGFNRWMPMRRFFSRIDQAMVEAGLPTGIAGDVDGMGQKLVQHHNDLNPWMDELTDITRQIDTEKLVSGSWSRMMMLSPAEREAAARAAGFSSKEIAAFGQMDDFLQRVLQHVNGTNEPVNTSEIWEYFSHIARRQSDPATVDSAFEYFPLSESTQAFHDFAQTGNLNFRELDPRHVGESFIRSLFWEKNMQEPWTALSEKWKGLASTAELKPAAEYMKNWLKIVRYGYAAEDDVALDALHGALRAFVGKEVTRQQAREVFNFGLNSTHSGMLGFRPHVMARDALQLFLAVPRAGADLLDTIRRFATSAEARNAIMDEAITEGAVSLQSPRMAAPGSFGGELEQLSAADAGAPIDASQYGWRMRTIAKVQSAVRDLMPEVLRDTRDSPLHAMYFYGKQSEVMRAMTYAAGKQKAARALAAFREGGSVDMASLMGESGARTYDPSWQREFQKLVAAGDDQGAAKFLGRQLADATQFKYGTVESPWAAKSLTGRLAMQMGNYQLQYLQYLRESMVNGTLGDKAKLAMTFGAVTAGLEAATRETGWNFRWMNPFFGLGFVGGPWVTIIPEMLRAGGDVVRELQGGNPNAAVRAAGGAALQQAAENLNPLGGLIRTGQGIGEAVSTSPYPGRALLRLGVTGERGNEPDVNQWLLPQAQQMFQQSLQQQMNPVSATRIGLPAGVFPPQPAAYNPLISSPFQTMPQGNQSPQVPVGGGGAYGMRNAPGVSATYDDVQKAASGDPNALQRFAPEDQQFLLNLAPLPPEARMAAWSQYTAVKINQQVQTLPTGNPNGFNQPFGGGGSHFPGTGGQQ